MRSPAGCRRTRRRDCCTDKSRHCSSGVFPKQEDGRCERMPPLKRSGEEKVRCDLEPFLFPPSASIAFFFFFFATPPDRFHACYKHRRAHFLLCRLALPLSTGGELRGKRSPPRAGPLELMCQVGDLPVSVFHHPPGLLFCHVPVTSVCPQARASC